MTRAEFRRAERQAQADRAFLASFPKPAPTTRTSPVNIWACASCQLPTVAIDAHQGVTPMALVCRARLGDFGPDGSPVVDEDALCGGRAMSTMYVLPDPESTPDWVARLLADPPWEWYCPTDLAELRSLDGETTDHVKRGGLLLRRRPGHGFDPTAEAVAADSEPIQAGRWKRFWAGLAR